MSTLFTLPFIRALRQPLPAGLMLLSLLLSACDTGNAPQQTSTTGTVPVTALPAFDYDGLDHGWTSPAQDSPGILTIDAGINNLDFDHWVSASNGWGPIERNMSVGEKGAGDGNPLTLAGQVYARGLGVHANSSMTFNVAAQCSLFTADIGVDDEVGDRGSVVFQVLADGKMLYDSGVMTGASATRTLSVDVSGKKELKLIVTDAGDGIRFDHADWAAPQLTCSPIPAGVGNPDGTLVYGGPLVISQGGTYSGNWESANADIAAVLVDTTEPVIIENSNIRGRGNLIVGYRSNLTVRSTRGYVINAQKAGKAAGRAINTEELYSLVVEHCFFEGTSGIYLRKYLGSADQATTVRIVNNRIRNIDGRQSDGKGGLNGLYDITQAVLFNDMKRVPNVEIAWNEIINEPDKSRVEENINMYLSSGTPDSPIQIHDNYIQGAYGIDPASDAQYAGGGILLGDGQVTDPLDSGYARVHDNQIVATTNHGLAIGGGTDNQIYNNRALSSGLLPDGQRLPATNVGLYVWDRVGAGLQTPPTFARNRMENNVVGWTRVVASGATANVPAWFPACGVNATSCTGNQFLGTVTPAMEQAEFVRWQAKLAANAVSIGP